MKCKLYEKYGQLYLSGELGEKEAEEYRLHLQSCEECRADLQAEEMIYRAVKEKAYKPAASLDAMVLEQLQKGRGRRKVFALQPAYAALMAAAVVAFIVFLNIRPFGNDAATVSSYAWDQGLDEIMEMADQTDYDELFTLNGDDELYAYTETGVTSEASESSEFGSGSEYYDELDDYGDEASELLEMLDYLSN
jgi:hypothetical protein